MRADGFAGSGATFWKRGDDAILIVNVQRSSSSGRFAINLGVLPIGDDELIPSRVKEYDCVFRGRLALDGVDHWWGYDAGSQASMDVAMTAAANLYADLGRRTFSAFEGPASLLATIRPEQFDSTRWAGLKVWPGQAALALAKLRRRQGQEEAAKAFALLARDISKGSGIATEAKAILDS